MRGGVVDIPERGRRRLPDARPDGALNVRRVEQQSVVHDTDSAADASITGNATEPLFNTAVSRETMKGYFDMSLPFCATSDSITASTTQTQVGGTAVLFKNYVRVVTGNANDAIRLPPISTVSIGVAITIGNASANALQVFPSTGQTINSGSANASVTQAASVTKTYVSSSATNWLQV